MGGPGIQLGRKTAWGGWRAVPDADGLGQMEMFEDVGEGIGNCRGSCCGPHTNAHLQHLCAGVVTRQRSGQPFPPPSRNQMHDYQKESVYIWWLWLAGSAPAAPAALAGISPPLAPWWPFLNQRHADVTVEPSEPRVAAVFRSLVATLRLVPRRLPLLLSFSALPQSLGPFYW